MRNKVLYICLALLSIILILPLAGCSAGEKPLLSSKQEALAHAQKLLPEFFDGNEQLEGPEQSVTVEHSSEHKRPPVWWQSMYFEEDYWSLHWTTSGENKGDIRIQLSAEDGTLTSFSYYPENSPETLKEIDLDKLLSREEAQKIAYDFAVRCYPDKMGDMAPRPASSQYASDYRPTLEYSFEWDRVIEGFSAPGNGIRVSVNALSGAVTELSCSWNEAIPAPERIASSEELTRRIIDQAGLYLTYIEDGTDDNGYPKAKLAYGLSTYHRQFEASSGAPVTFYGENIPWAKARIYQREYTPVPAPEQKVTIQMPGERKTPEETKAIAASFLKTLGIEGELHQGGKRWDSGPPYPKEVLYFRLSGIEHYHPDWERVEVSVDTATGMVESFSRQPKDNRKQSPQRQLSRAQAQDLALKFLKDIKIYTSNMVPETYADYYIFPFRYNYLLRLRTTPAYNFYWVRLVNGVPFPSDSVTVSVSRNGEILNYTRNNYFVGTFESTEGILSPEEAVAALAAAQPLELQYGQTGNPLKEKLKMRLLYNFSTTHIDAHTGEVIKYSYPDPKLGPYLAKSKGHWAEIPLGLLAQTGKLPPPEDFHPDNTVTRREFLRISAQLAHSYISHEEERLHSPFLDVSINDRDIWAILHNVWGGIIEPGGNLKPEEPLTRKDAVAWLANLVNSRNVDSGTLASTGNNPDTPITWGELSALIIRTIPLLEN